MIDDDVHHADPSAAREGTIDRLGSYEAQWRLGIIGGGAPRASRQAALLGGEESWRADLRASPPHESVAHSF